MLGKKRALSKEEAQLDDEFLDELRGYIESKIEISEIEYINKKHQHLKTLRDLLKQLGNEGRHQGDQLVDAIIDGDGGIIRELNNALNYFRNSLIDTGINFCPSRIGGSREDIEQAYRDRGDRSDGLPGPYRELNRIVNEIILSRFPFARAIGRTKDDEDDYIFIMKEIE